MKYLFLNPDSCSGLAQKKWSKVKAQLPDLAHAIIVDDFYAFNWNQIEIAEGDTFISAGGDGTLHCMVNAMIQHKGVEILSKIKVGHIGLGSNNSFLRPYSECVIINDIPMRIKESTYTQDLIEIEVKTKDGSQTIYCVANSSLGFLASANIIFNSSADIAVLKKWNSDLADVYTFIKALINYQPIEVFYEINNSTSKNHSITNMHFMKKPFYATDLGFPEVIHPASGNFRLNILWERNKLSVLKKFFSMLFFKKLQEGRDLSEVVISMKVRSEELIPIEMDGEIYYGTNFLIKTRPGGIQLCQ